MDGDIYPVIESFAPLSQIYLRKDIWLFRKYFWLEPYRAIVNVSYATHRQSILHALLMFPPLAWHRDHTDHTQPAFALT